MKIFFASLCAVLLISYAASADVLDVQPYDRMKGNEAAPVTMVEYSSLSCPHCAEFHTKVLPELEKKYIDTGKMRLLARNFPTNASALKGSMLTMCVPEDKYYTFLKVLFNTQQKWAMSMDYEENLKRIARVGGVSEEDFKACMGDKALEEKVLNIRKEAEVLDIQATPTFFINGHKVQGAQPVEEFIKIIDAELAKQ